MMTPSSDTEAYPLPMIAEDLDNCAQIVGDDLDHLAEHLRAARNEGDERMILDLSVAGDRVQIAWAYLKTAHRILATLTGQEAR